MTQAPPVDQRIVDEYFQLVSHKKTKDVAWLYAMVATFGIKPDQLFDFHWCDNNSICVPGKKRTIRPLHPQWVLLFKLKEKQPYKLQSCWDSLSLSLYRAMAYQETQLNITDLLLAYRIRKDYTRPIKPEKQSSRVFSVAS
jgi:hypothetical protein